MEACSLTYASLSLFQLDVLVTRAGISACKYPEQLWSREVVLSWNALHVACQAQLPQPMAASLGGLFQSDGCRKCLKGYNGHVCKSHHNCIRLL